MAWDINLKSPKIIYPVFFYQYIESKFHLQKIRIRKTDLTQPTPSVSVDFSLFDFKKYPLILTRITPIQCGVFGHSHCKFIVFLHLG